MKSLAERVAEDPKVQDVFIDNTCGCLRGVDAAMIQPIIDAVVREIAATPKCQRVEQRIECTYCGYPYSEALVSTDPSVFCPNDPRHK